MSEPPSRACSQVIGPPSVDAMHSPPVRHPGGAVYDRTLTVATPYVMLTWGFELPMGSRDGQPELVERTSMTVDVGVGCDYTARAESR